MTENINPVEEKPISSEFATQPGGEKEDVSSLRSSRRPFPNLMDLLSLLGVFFLGQVVAMFVILLSGIDVAENSGLVTCISYAASFGGALLFAIPYSRYRSNNGFSPIRLSLRGFNVITIFWAFLLIVAMGLVIEPLLALFDNNYFEQLSKMMDMGGYMVFTAIVLAPILEEMLFRGVIQGAVTRRKGPFAGVLISALIFGIIHLNPVQVVNAFFVGLVLGYVYHRTCTLWSVIVLHMLNNSFSYFMWMLSGNQIASLREVVTNQTVYTVIYTISAVLCVVSFVFLFRNLRDKEEKKLLDK